MVKKVIGECYPDGKIKTLISTSKHGNVLATISFRQNGTRASKTSYYNVSGRVMEEIQYDDKENITSKKTYFDDGCLVPSYVQDIQEVQVDDKVMKSIHSRGYDYDGNLHGNYTKKLINGFILSSMDFNHGVMV